MRRGQNLPKPEQERRLKIRGKKQVKNYKKEHNTGTR
jgi:hypothetical protein